MSEEKLAKIEGELLQFVIERGAQLEEIVKKANAEHEAVRKELWLRITSAFGLPENVEGNLDMQYKDQGVVIFRYREPVESANAPTGEASQGIGDQPAGEASAPAAA